MLVNYGYYWGYYYLIPLLICCVCFGVLMFIAFHTTKYIRARDFSFKSAFKTVFWVVVMLVMFIQSGIVLFCRGNIYLLMEKEDDAVTITGSIEDIAKAHYSYVLYGQTKMYEFTINDTVCTAIYVPTENSPAKTPFKVGDYVEVLYLPRSGYILSIEEIPKTDDVPSF